MAVLLIALTSGCGLRLQTSSYCEIAAPMYFDTDKTVEWLAAHDRGLLVDVLVNNETWERVCHKV